MTSAHVSTLEAAAILDVARPSLALAILRAAKARGMRLGTALLWDRRDVAALRDALAAANLGPARMAVDAPEGGPA